MTVLLTGGMGRSAKPLAERLHAANIPFLIANRSGVVPEPFRDRGVQFDWLDSSTYRLPFEADKSIDRVYLIAPSSGDPIPPMKAFIDFAIQQGVKRFVLMSAAPAPIGGPMMGKVHEYLDSLGVEYCALRPSWFFENLVFSLAAWIREHNEIANAVKSGKIGWISNEDIADVAFKALTDSAIEHNNPIMVGPELLTFAQIADLFTDILGRKIAYREVTPTESKEIILKQGRTEEFAEMKSKLEGLLAEGLEERCYYQADFVGKRTMREFIEERKAAWEVGHA
ncbi:NAD(P)-binding protein [Favolaschia claudopus]|uniref:NAD(P)-binding protein n=1 Tax=Favolaschia claudopus TaxID=2862362 RepID=A0AAW0DFP6_9AGAR